MYEIVEPLERILDEYKDGVQVLCFGDWPQNMTAWAPIKYTHLARQVPRPLIAFSYRATVQTKKDEWMEVKLPLDRFVATSFGRPAKDAGPVDPQKVNGLGFILADKKAGPFKLEVEWIKLVKAVK